MLELQCVLSFLKRCFGISEMDNKFYLNRSSSFQTSLIFNEKKTGPGMAQRHQRAA